MPNIKITDKGDTLKDVCPECIKEGQKSKLYIENSKRIGESNVDKYHDENGKKHLHKMSAYTGKWKCSNEHGGYYKQHYLCNVKDCEYSKI